MDQTTVRLGEFAATLQFRDLPSEVVHEAKRRVLDTLGCAIGGMESEPAQMLRRITTQRICLAGATVFGSATRTTPELAAFANSVMVRYLDFNDRARGGHPSDYLPAVIAAAEMSHCDIRTFIAAIVAAYEIFSALGRLGAGVRERGWDQGTVGVAAAAGGAARALGLNTNQTAEAIGIAVSSNISLRQIRAGELSMWKGAATPYAAQAGTLAAFLAAEGMTAPERPFEGAYGLRQQVTGPVDVPPLGGDQEWRILEVDTKYWPVEYNAQLAVWAGQKIRASVKSVEDIESIVVHTYNVAWTEIGSEAAKWDPQTRETADHSMPYVLSVALLEGAISLEDFEMKKFRDPKRLALMQKIKVVDDPAMTSLWPHTVAMRVEVATRGAVQTFDFREPKGRWNNRMSDQELEDKFVALVHRSGIAGVEDSLITRVWALEKEQDFAGILSAAAAGRRN